MVNEAFSILSDEERTTKLKTVLKNRSGGYITEEEIKAIMAFVSLQKQYVIRIYNEPTNLGKVLFWQIRAGVKQSSAVQLQVSLDFRIVILTDHMQPHMSQEIAWILFISISRRAVFGKERLDQWVTKTKRKVCFSKR